ncbi:MAG: cell surface protein SprA [Candidatus Electryonea clarkiae]|nr:cell surface protein SprA [Candidatus Electryonea clarkiae]MDP8286977.1 cell surface protein SprA [Candidatus Electryonea clarkiae]
MRAYHTRSKGRKGNFASILLLLLLWVIINPTEVLSQTGYDITPPIPGDFDPEADLRAPKPIQGYSFDSLAVFSHEGMLFTVETEYDSAKGYYIATRYLFGEEYGLPKVFTPEQYRAYRLKRQRKEKLREKFYKTIYTPRDSRGGGALEIQVPFKIKSKTFRRIFGGDRVGLRVSGRITIDGGLRREKSDQQVYARTDQTQTNFKIDQTQQFHITGKVGDKVSVEIDQDSERMFDFENAVKLTYIGEEDEIIQSIEAGNVNLSLPGTQLATLSTHNKGLFGFKTVSKVGPLEVTSIMSLQKGEKNKKTLEGGSEKQTYKFEDKDFIKDQYFFIDESFRDSYSNFNSDFYRIAAEVEVIELEVFRSKELVGGENDSYYDGFAMYDSAQYYSDPSDIEATVIALKSDSARQSDRGSAGKLFELLVADQDYVYDKNLGYIRLNFQASTNHVIAVAYRLSRPIPGEASGKTEWGTLGNTSGFKVLKLIKQESQKPSDPTWNLSWRHVYWVGTTGLRPDDFTFRIFRNETGGLETHEGASWLQIFGVDQRGEGGSANPDSKIDETFVNLAFGEIAFPDLRPFDPQGYKVNEALKSSELDTLVNPKLYNQLHTVGTLESFFRFEAEYSNVSSTFNLGFNILEESEEVIINGAKQRRGTDYTIDYLSGTLTILNEDAFAAGANVEISYESGEIFQLDRRTMIGIRLEYALWEDSFLGGTFLYFNEKPIDKRVKVGNEPLRNLIWDINARIKFRPYIMTSMVDALPLIDTDEPSELSFEGEIAQVFPNPNSLNNNATGDPEGVAYIDDFEAAKRATPMGVMLTGWFPASFPKTLPSEFGSLNPYDIRGRLFWYNPRNQIPIKDIWPQREVNSKVANSVHVLTLDYDPTVNNYRRTGTGYEPESTWNGVMRGLSAGYHNQTETKFIEIWAKWTARGHDAAIFIDIGAISEDVIPNQLLDTEDEPIPGQLVGNLVLDDGEDTGLDGIDGADPPWDFLADDYNYSSHEYDWWDLNNDGVHNEGDPSVGGEPFSSDNYNWERGDYDQVNGSEDNETAEKGRYPDSEDLDRDNQLTRPNHFFRYRFRLSNPDDSLKYIVGGQENEKGWRLIRIPLEDTLMTVGTADLTEIKFIRIWLGGHTGKSAIQIAQFELTGNEWLEDPVINPVTKIDSSIYLTTTTINTHDNPEDYISPPGVAGDIDPITDIRSKEQSLVIKVLELPSAQEGQVIKTLYRSQNLREYKILKMFVNGGGRFPQSLQGKNLEMFLRFGSGFSGNKLGYYEYSQRLQPGWSGNEITIDLDRLNNLKRIAELDSSNTAYEVLPNGDVLKVVGNPSVGKIDAYAIGLRNFGAPIREEDNVEIWVDELRLSGIRKEIGMALRTSASAKFADLLDVRLDMNQRDADFHQVDKRVGSNKSELSANLNASIKLDKVLDPKLGISIPLSGSVKNSLGIPKYTTSNGDIRTEGIAKEGSLNIWDQFGRFMMKRDHLADRYLLDSTGAVVMDTINNIPKQDLSKWEIDTLFQTDQQYTWRLGFSKNKPSPNFLLRYTVDQLSPSYSHNQSYSSNLNFQYKKTFSNSAKLGYSIPFESSDLRILSWLEPVPFLKKYSDARFNYLPSRLSGNIDGNESRGSEKYRNGKEIPSYNLNLTRGFNTGVRPFQALNADYSFNVSSKFLREDSTRQLVFYSDQPEPNSSDSAGFSLKNVYFAPGTANTVIIDSTLLRLEILESVGFEEAGILANEIEMRLAENEPISSIVEYTFRQLDIYSWADNFKRPWERIGSDDPRYKDKFWEAWKLPFVDVQKTQRVSGNYNPDVFSWIGTRFNYSTTYNWSWKNYSYSGRSVSSSNSLGANFTFKLRQILPADKSGGKKESRGSNNRRESERSGFEDYDDFRAPDAGGFGREEESAFEQDSTSNQRKRDDKPKPPPIRINPLKGLLWAGRKIQDPTVNYSQSLNFSNPTVEDGTANLNYQLGLTGDPGLKTIPGFTSVPGSQRTDDYRFGSGVDWTTRITSGLNYTVRMQRSTSQQVTGGVTKSGFYTYKDDEVSLKKFDVPNWSLRWGGIEQLGPLSKIAQSISFDHSYSGTFSEDWIERIVTISDTVAAKKVREINRRQYEKSFNPLGKLNITWKYRISTTIGYNQSERVSEDPKNGSKSRDTSRSITLNASYTRKTGFRVPLPIWPFKGRRFNNETTFSLGYDQSNSRSEKQQEGFKFEQTQEQSSWSATPNINYTFSKTVTGGIRYKYGETKSSTFTTTYQEFGINVNISIRG